MLSLHFHAAHIKLPYEIDSHMKYDTEWQLSLNSSNSMLLNESVMNPPSRRDFVLF